MRGAAGLSGFRIHMGTHETPGRKASIVLAGPALAAAALVRKVCQFPKVLTPGETY